MTKISKRSILACLCGLVLSTSATSVAFAQFQELTAENTKPAFQVEPVVQRLQSRRGQQVDFSFALTSLSRSTNVEVRAVAMHQLESGAIMPDTENPPPTEVQLLTPEKMTLREDTETTIRGKIRVPTTNSPFHVFGILVTDFGQQLPNNNAASDPAEARVQIEFVTRYLLRIEIDVNGVRPTDAGKLVFEDAQLFEERGYPKVRMVVSNPSDSPIEFEVQCRLLNESTPETGKPFPLGMPIRVNVEPPEKHQARILPGARIFVEEFVPVAVFPGEYNLEAKIVSARRTWKTETFAVNAEDGAFPGQAASVARLAPGVSASPAQVELSMQRGGQRYVSILIANNTKEVTRYDFTPRNLDATEADWFAVRPSTMTLQPGASRKVLVTMGSNHISEDDLYGRLMVSTQANDGVIIGTEQIAVALVARGEGDADLELGNLAWGEDRGASAVVLPVTNSGDRHASVDGRMTMTDIDSGKQFTFAGGFGKWLLPGDDRNVIFRIPEALPPAKYELKIMLRSAADSPIMQLKTLVELSNNS